MRVLVWLLEDTWPAAVDAARRYSAAEVLLLHVTPADVVEAAHGAFLGLWGRGAAPHDPAAAVRRLAADAESELLAAAARRLGRPAQTLRRSGEAERVVVAAAAQERVDLLVVARDGDRRRLGPRSLGPATRFVVDHAPCDVLLVWPEPPPGLDSMPPPPPHR